MIIFHSPSRLTVLRPSMLVMSSVCCACTPETNASSRTHRISGFILQIFSAANHGNSRVGKNDKTGAQPRHPGVALQSDTPVRKFLLFLEIKFQPKLNVARGYGVRDRAEG